jgi:hypothetical protein
MVCIDPGKVPPLLGQIILSKDRRHRANRDTSATINALDWVDVKLSIGCESVFVLARMNAVNWAGIHTGGVFGSDARFSDYVCHTIADLLKFSA